MGQELEERRAIRGDDLNPPVRARRDTARPYSADQEQTFTLNPLLNVCDKQPFRVSLHSELYELPTDSGSTPHLQRGWEENKGALLKDVS